MTSQNYILDATGNAVAEPDLIRWAEWMEYSREKRIVARDNIGESRVSTVFLGMDHNFSNEGPPVLWETLVFDGPMEGEMDRCAGSREQAEAMHARMVARVKGAP